MAVWKLTIEYDGTRYHGWQEQKNARTIAGEIRRAAGAILQAPVELSGAGRTDTGVHALAQVARLQAPGSIPLRELMYGLNDNLPADINILRTEKVNAQFHARHDALARYYIYQIARRRSAFTKKYVWWVRDHLSSEAMAKAAQYFLGRHDFSQFCDRRDEEGGTVVAVECIELIEVGDLLLFRIGATHFLWKMVRRLVGALVAVGRGRLPVNEMVELLHHPRQERKTSFDVAANTAPPSGLFLERVIYPSKERPTTLTPITPVDRWR